LPLKLPVEWGETLEKAGAFATKVASARP
jgi:hypothetical protein